MAKFLVESMAERYRLKRPEAEYLVSVASGASIGAANYGQARESRRAEIIHTTLRFIFAGIQDYVESDQPRRRSACLP